MFKKFLYLCLFCIVANARFITETGYRYSFYQYEEPGLMKINGTLHAFFAKLAYISDFISTEMNYAQSFNANLKYNGSTQGGTPLVNIPSEDNFFNADYKIGARLGLYNNYEGFGYLGIGYRYLNNRISGSGGYRREQVYYYVPVGFYASDSMSSRGLFARYGFEFRYMFLGINKTHIGDAIQGINPSVLEMEQKHGLGFRTHFGFDYIMINDFKLFTQLSAEYWYIRESSVGITTYKDNSGKIVQQSWVEPRNNTVQFSIEVGLGF
ncbi:hypothetical protein [Helicobacter sp. MIT 99-5507]|uniref:hypothetical protein n=1 Tax=Helicobacter sp. MIT 99-5507 TaxID=152489 RepID=UPI000E1F880C|nr:hypothetical protein [Helicobacter sp. MIT 99-5507]RDU56704.1 hypothetical protein CQA42_07795 [Helicobacter sp. MIT 99-5507]